MIVRIPSNSYSREVEEGKVDMRAGRDKKVIEKKSYWIVSKYTKTNLFI